MDTNDSAPTFQAPSLEELTPLLPSYTLETFIAQGGMGAVYQARQKSLDRPVAIKILPREFGSDPAFRESFSAEAKAMARLNHPNLIGVYDFGDIDGMLFLVMEIVHGKSLYHSCYGKTIHHKQASELIIAICEGIDHAHEADILHRDIKPSNILLSQDATPKVGDFGLASPMNQSTNTEDVIYGTPGYTAPEVIHRQTVDRRADIFSIGVMLHELLTGSLPDESRTAPSLICSCPPGYDTIVAKSTQPNPALRYTSAAEMAEALANVSSQAKSALNTKLATSSVTSTTRTRTPVAIPSKKSPLPLVITLVAIAAVIGIAIFASQNSNKTPDPTSTAPIVEPVASSTSESSPSKPKAKPKARKDKKNTTLTKTTPPAPRKQNDKQTLEDLERLKDKLASGSRNEFPKGTVARNNSHFLILTQPFSWHKAQRFAEEHGAHLATLPNKEDRKWLLSQFSAKKPLWIGAGIAANNTWQWLDASPWSESDTPPKPQNPSPYDGYLTLSGDGSLKPKPAGKDHSIILQWRDDSSNPCKMDEQLHRLLDSIKEKGIAEARYPVGTRTYEQSHFLLLNKQLSWEESYQFATDHRSHLAIPSTPAENQWLKTTFNEEYKKLSYWLGGFLLNAKSPWQWTTKEAWHFSGWQADQPGTDVSQNHMIMVLDTDGSSSTSEHWTSSYGANGETNAILLEWSKPKPTTSVSEFDLERWLADVNRKIALRVKPSIENYNKERSKLITDHIRDMKRAAKKIQSGRRNDRLQDLVEAAMDQIESSGQLPNELPRRTPDDLKEIHAATQADLKKLAEDHQTALKTQLDFYLKGLSEKATTLEKTGFIQQARSLNDTIENIGEDIPKFTETLGL